MCTTLCVCCSVQLSGALPTTPASDFTSLHISQARIQIATCALYVLQFPRTNWLKGANWRARSWRTGRETYSPLCKSTTHLISSTLTLIISRQQKYCYSSKEKNLKSHDFCARNLKLIRLFSQQKIHSSHNLVTVLCLTQIEITLVCFLLSFSTVFS